jgi:hypothetical protein
MSYTSQTKYDERLKSEISFYQLHPMMLPFIGENFEKYKILLVSESHYLPKEEKNEIKDDWYNPDVVWYDEKSKWGKRIRGNHRTRKVVENFDHKLFKNLKTELKTHHNSLDFSYFAWYNFFQKPAMHGATIKKQITKKDIEVSHEIFEKLISILQPNAVLFISKLAFDSLQKDAKGKFVRKYSPDFKAHQFKNYELPIYWAHHPNSLYWNRKNKTVANGAQRFQNALKQVFTLKIE